MARSLILRTKFNGIVIIVFLVLAVVNAIDDYRRQQALVIRGAVDHAQILVRQIVQSREYLLWVTRDELERNPNLIPQVVATSIAKLMSEGSLFHVR